MSNVEDNSADSPLAMDIIKAAKNAVKSLDGNTLPPITELLTTLLTEAEKYGDNIPPSLIENLTNFLRDLEEHCEGKSTASSSEVSSNENQRERKIGKIKVFLSKEIGRSTNGTIVYEGHHEGREVAVKRLLQSHFKRNEEAEREMATLKASDHSQNIVRYYGSEEDLDFIYLALERCDCNLDDLIQMYPKNSSQDKPKSEGLEKREIINPFKKNVELRQKNIHCPSSQHKPLAKLSEDLQKLKNTIGDIKLWKENTCRPCPLLRKLMRDMVSGLDFLHNKGIVHRDLKPQNILIIRGSPNLCAKLADMGISRQLRKNKKALTPHKSSVCAATGWKAPEQLLRGQQTPALDLFSLGCILYFSITGGEHPFGDDDGRNGNIKNKAYEPDFFLIEDFPEAVDLISSLIKFDAGERPQANNVLHHPLFWNAEDRLKFLRYTSNSVSKYSTLSDNKKTTLLRRLESTAYKIVGKNRRGNSGWDKKILNDKLKDTYQSILEGYDFGSVKHLLRFIRNRWNHYIEDPKEIQDHFGPLDEGFDDYFTSRFPKLFFEVYNVVRDCFKEDDFFKAYFEGDHEEVTV